MGLDISQVKDDSSIGNSVSFSVEDHWEFMKYVDETMESLGRLRDYYAEVKFSTADLPTLLIDLKALRESELKNTPLLEKALALYDLVEVALIEGIEVAALPD